MIKRITALEKADLLTGHHIEETANVAEEVGGIALRGAVEHIFTLQDPNKLGVYLDIGKILEASYPGLGNYMAERTFNSAPLVV